jgi:peptide deformylase
MSSLLSIHTYGDPVLREPSRPVESITPEILALIEDMFAPMKANRASAWPPNRSAAPSLSA